MSEQIEIWDLWFPEAAAQGLPFARGRLQATSVLLAHAAPANLRVDVMDDAGKLLARGTNLRRTAETPIALLSRRDGRIEREDIWPGERERRIPEIIALRPAEARRRPPSISGRSSQCRSYLRSSTR